MPLGFAAQDWVNSSTPLQVSSYLQDGVQVILWLQAKESAPSSSTPWVLIPPRHTKMGVLWEPLSEEVLLAFRRVFSYVYLSLTNIANTYIAMTRQTTEKDRYRIRVLFFEGKHPKAEIHRLTGFSMHQIRKAIDSEKIKPRSGRPTLLSESEEAELIEYIRSSIKARRMTYLQLSQTLFDKKYGEFAIRSTLRRHGYKRYVALRKPPLSDKNKALRLEFA